MITRAVTKFGTIHRWGQKTYALDKFFKIKLEPPTCLPNISHQLKVQLHFVLVNPSSKSSNGTNEKTGALLSFKTSPHSPAYRNFFVLDCIVVYG